MLNKTRDLLLMYLGIVVGLIISALFLFYFLEDSMGVKAKAFVLILAGVSMSIFAYFHRPK
jgi:hypothetical protein